MSRRRRGEPPRLIRHKASGLGYITINKQRIYLGRFGSTECRRAYRAELQRWEEEQRAIQGRTLYMGRGATVAELVDAYMREVAPTKYQMDGLPTDTLRRARLYLVDGLAKEFGDMLADEFRHPEFEELRRQYVGKGYARASIKVVTGHVLGLFKWGHKRGAVSAETLTSLSASPEPNEGVETDPIEPVPREHFETVLAALERTKPSSRKSNSKGIFVSKRLRLAAMLRLQDLVGMRPGELCRMKGKEIRMDATVIIQGKTVQLAAEDGSPYAGWVFQPSRFKTRKRGRYLAYLVGPQARTLLERWLPSDPDAFVWRQADGGEVLYQAYLRAVAAACRRAGVPAWKPNQLRHSCLGRYAAIGGIEKASNIVSHASINTTMTYVQRNLSTVIPLVEANG